MAQSSIEWTEQTWNPTTGCTKVSPGCKNCYAEVMARRLHAIGVKGYENNFRLTILPERLEEPLRRNRPTMYFVNSMSDIFHKSIPDSFIQDVFRVMKQTPQHTYQVLTKRADRMQHFFDHHDAPRNLWMGVSVEDRESGVPRIERLRKTKVPIRFLSIEPLLEHIGSLDLASIHWVIVGGESGHQARPMEQEWVLNIKCQCEEQGVLFFFKQWGGWGVDGKKRGKKKNGRLLLGQTWDAMPMVARELITES